MKNVEALSVENKIASDQDSSRLKISLLVSNVRIVFDPTKRNSPQAPHPGQANLLSCTHLP